MKDNKIPGLVQSEGIPPTGRDEQGEAAQDLDLDEQEVEAADVEPSGSPASLERAGLYQDEWRELARGQVELSEKVEELAGRLEETNRLLTDYGGKLEKLTLQNQALERASAELSRLGEDFYNRHVLEPMIRCIFPLYDLLADAVGRQQGEGVTGSGSTLKLVQALRSEVVEFLAQFGVEPYRHRAGARFNRRLMRPIRLVPTGDPALDFKVVRSCQTGFRQDQRILRPEAVILYRFEGQGQQGPAANGGGE